MIEVESVHLPHSLTRQPSRLCAGERQQRPANVRRPVRPQAVSQQHQVLLSEPLPIHQVGHQLAGVVAHSQGVLRGLEVVGPVRQGGPVHRQDVVVAVGQQICTEAISWMTLEGRFAMWPAFKKLPPTYFSPKDSSSLNPCTIT